MKRSLRISLALLILFAMTATLALAHDTTIMLMEENNSTQSGTAVFTDLGDGTTRVVVELSNGSAVPQPAHIHAGQCGPTLDPKPAYPLSNVVNGRSESVVPVDVHDLTGGTYAVNVHKSAAEVQVYVACGNITADMPHGDTPGMPRTGGSFELGLALLALLGTTLIGSGLVLARRRV
jgi:hypothetical protein